MIAEGPQINYLSVNYQNLLSPKIFNKKIKYLKKYKQFLKVQCGLFSKSFHLMKES